LPRKRGFTNIFKAVYSLVNVGDLKRFDANSEVSAETLYMAGLIKSLKKPVKVLGNGEIDRPLSIKASKFSSSAKAKIEAAGGKMEAI
jgi:large subunit ribosomal protein L15